MAHLVSTGLGRVTVFLRMLDEARARGVDVTTEVYPYTAGVTEIGSRTLDGDWQKRFGVGYGHVEVLATGQRFTGQAMWDEYRARRHSEQIVIHAMREEWVEQALRHPGVMVASDALFIRRTDERSHPRNAGTFSRVLGRYSRERGVLTLSDAIARMTWLPARRLETVSPAMRGKGRLGLGADADIAVFDAGRIIDQATFVDSSRYSAGIVHVLVGGTAVVRDGELVKGVFSGRAVRAGAKPGS